MRQVVLDSNYYEITGDIQRRNINPFAARIDTGEPGFSSFTQASVEEWHGMRGGIGVKYQKASGTEELYFSEGLNHSLDQGIILGPKVNTAGTFGKACLGMFDFDGSGSMMTYAYGDDLIAEWSGTDWASKETGLSDPIDAIVVTDETDTYAVVSSATAAYYSSNGTNWSALTGCKGYLAVFDNRLMGFYGQTVNYSPHGNIDGTWATFNVSAYLGTPHKLFAGKLLSNGDPVLYLASSEGLWAIDFWTQQIYKQEISYPPHTSAGYTAMYWDSYVFVGTGAGIKKLSPGMATDVGPDQNDGLPSGYQGAVVDMLGLADWLVYCVNGGSTDRSSIFRRHGSIGGNQQIYTTAAINTPIRCIHYSPSSLYTNGRLWWGEGTSIKYCMCPDFNADPIEISGYEFASSPGKAIFSIFRPLAPFNKLALRIMAVTKGCDDNKYWTIYHKINHATDWTSLGVLKSSPSPTALEFASGAGTEFRTIQFATEAVTNAAASTPELKSLMFAYLACTQRLRAWTFMIRANQHNSQTIIDNLHATQDKDTLVLFYPSGKTTDTGYRVKLTALPENIHWDASRQEGEAQVTVEEIFRG